MKVIDFNFRDIDKMIIQLDDVKLLDKVDLKLDVPYYGVIYIDHEKGISLRILGDENNNLIVGVPYILRYDDIKNIEVVEVEDYKNKELVLKMLDPYYSDSHIIDIRKIVELDKFRLRSNPDTVLVNFNKDNDTEQMWCRVMGSTSDGLVCGLLTDSNLFDNLVRGTNIMAKVSDNEELICIGRIDL
ncbi:MAG: hypothetical protein IKE89_02790 [Bacilli bacterium]|nr:hypothetical protein [Bacilli bacterium]